LFIVWGGFSQVETLAPFTLSSLDPTGLHAEADAIDMQIKLTDVNYALATSTGVPSYASSPSPKIANKPVSLLAVRAAASTSSLQDATGTNNSLPDSPSSTTVTIDQ